jgi:hypothetical protein
MRFPLQEPGETIHYESPARKTKFFAPTVSQKYLDAEILAESNADDDNEPVDDSE